MTAPSPIHKPMRIGSYGLHVTVAGQRIEFEYVTDTGAEVEALDRRWPSLGALVEHVARQPDAPTHSTTPAFAAGGASAPASALREFEDVCNYVAITGTPEQRAVAIRARGDMREVNGEPRT